MTDQSPKASWEKIAFKTGCAILLIPICFGFLALTIMDGRTPARRAACSNNLRNIALALQQYHANFGSYPPPYIADASGKPLHSWRVLLLPYLDQKALHSQYRFDESWDGPNNSKLHNIVVKLFCCPADENASRKAETSYVVVTGPKTPWRGASSHLRDADLLDGLSNTILVVEVASSGIHWMEHRDLDINQMPMTINARSGQGISSNHPGGANVAFANGRIEFLTNDTSPEILRALLTSSGKEPPGQP